MRREEKLLLWKDTILRLIALWLAATSTSLKGTKNIKLNARLLPTLHHGSETEYLFYHKYARACLSEEAACDFKIYGNCFPPCKYITDNYLVACKVMVYEKNGNGKNSLPGV